MHFRIGIALLVLGGVLAYFGVPEGRLSASASATPEEISLKDLLDRGADGNPHITLTDFGYLEDFIYSKKRDGEWSRIWVPAVPKELKKRRGPLGEPLPPLTSVPALVTTTGVKNQSDLDKFCHLPTVEGMVVNKIDSLTSGQKEQLKDSYPDTDFDRCLIIEVGRQPASALKVMGLLGGSAASLLAGAGVLLWAWKGRALGRVQQPANDASTKRR